MKKNFNQLVETFSDSIKTWSYLVNWNKVFSNSSDFEIILNKLNYLLGKKDLKKEFIKLYSDSSEIIKALPVLLAVREKKLEILREKREKMLKLQRQARIKRFNEELDQRVKKYSNRIEKISNPRI